MVLGNLDSHMGKSEIGNVSYTIHTQKKLKWVNGIKTIQESIKYTMENTSRILQEIEAFSMRQSQKIRQQKQKINKWNYT